MQKHRRQDIDRRWPGRLRALALAGVLCLAVTAPALADFESAVAAYEDGAYREAESDFEALAAAGDQRAAPYLERIREKLRNALQASESATSKFLDSLTSIFDESDATGEGSPSTVASRKIRSSAAKPSANETASARGSWSAFGDEISPATLPVSDVARPERTSIWSTVFHLPGDATVVGLQYVARFLDADTLSRELHRLGGHGDKIALSILAGFWWLVIVKILVGLGLAIGRMTKAPATMEGQKRYG